MAFNIEGARESGYSDSDIAQYLSQSKGFDYEGAINAGHGDTDIIGHLMEKPSAQPSENVLAWKDVATQALTNAPESALEFGKALLTVVRHPIETGKGIMNIAIGAGQKVLPKDIRIFPEEQKQAETVGQFFADRYGGIENLKRTIAQDPVGFLADASVVLGGAGLRCRCCSKRGRDGRESWCCVKSRTNSGEGRQSIKSCRTCLKTSEGSS
jgi:hypothetical protein